MTTPPTPPPRAPVPPNSLYVKNLPNDVTEQAIAELFQRFGGVKKVEVPNPVDRSKNFAFVEMDR